MTVYFFVHFSTPASGDGHVFQDDFNISACYEHAIQPLGDEHNISDTDSRPPMDVATDSPIAYADDEYGSLDYDTHSNIAFGEVQVINQTNILGEIIGTRGLVSVDRALLSDSYLIAFFYMHIQDSGHDFFVIDFEDGTGYLFAGSNNIFSHQGIDNNGLPDGYSVGRQALIIDGQIMFESFPDDYVSVYEQAVETEYVPAYLQITVWVPRTRNYIYHSINNCGTMNPDLAISYNRADIRTLGYRACERCW